MTGSVGEANPQPDTPAIRLVSLLAVLTAVAVPLLRQRGTPPWDRLHGEDGPIYAAQAIHDGPFAVLFRGYAGYLQLPSRLVIGAGSAFPRENLAVFVATASSVVVALLALFVFDATRTWIRCVPLRALLAASFCVMPAMGGENTGNATNLIWAFAAAAPWAFLSTDKTLRRAAGRSAVAGLAAMSTPLCILYLPIVAWRTWRDRSVADIAVCTTYLIGLAVQLTVVATTRQSVRSTNNLFDLLKLTSSRVFATALVGDRGVDALWGRHGTAIMLVSSVVVVGCWAALLSNCPSSNRVVAVVLGALALAIFVLPVALRGSSYLQFFFHDARPKSGAMRYSVVPVFLLLSSFAVLLAPSEVASKYQPRLRNWAAYLLIAQVLLTTTVWFSITNPDSYNASWRKQIIIARATCSKMSPDTVVYLTMTQLDPNAARMPVACRDL